jgi:hypothetical protein
MAKLNKSTFVVKLINRDEFQVDVWGNAEIAWEQERPLRNWPPMNEAPVLWQAYLTWFAAKKANLIDPSTPFDVYAEDVESIDWLKAVDVDPTPGGPEHD